MIFKNRTFYAPTDASKGKSLRYSLENEKHKGFSKLIKSTYLQKKVRFNTNQTTPTAYRHESPLKARQINTPKQKENTTEIEAKTPLKCNKKAAKGHGSPAVKTE